MLENGTKVKHKRDGYKGRIDGTTSIKNIFTGNANCDYQYRIFIEGQERRKIAPEEDLEILSSREGMIDKARIVMRLVSSGFESDGSGQTVCHFEIEAKGPIASELVRKINYETYHYVRSRTAERKLKITFMDDTTGDTEFELIIKGIGHDNRGRWCRTFRTKLKNACNKHFGDEMFFQDGYCVFEQNKDAFLM
jgi:hypothetical protein